MLYFPSHREPTGNLQQWLEDGSCIGYCREVPTPKTIWLMMHGNAGQASDREYVLAHVAPTDSFYVLEYPGYGQKPGSPSLAAFNDAARGAYHLLKQKFPSTPIGVIGESIGTGPSCSLAKESTPPDRIVLVVPFDRLKSVASRRFFFLPVSLLLLDNWDNIESLQGYNGQVDIYGARQDTIIPCSHARNLAIATKANFHEIQGGHNDWSRMVEGIDLFSAPRSLSTDAEKQ